MVSSSLYSESHVVKRLTTSGTRVAVWQSMRRIAMAVSILLITATTLAAQQLVTSDGEMDVPDLIRAWRHKGPRPPVSLTTG
jgi:hypothetical protein